MDENTPLQDEKNSSDVEDDDSSYVSYYIADEKPSTIRTNKCFRIFAIFWKYTFGKIGADWLYLTLLGITMAWISLPMDYVIGLCTEARIILYHDLTTHPVVQYLAWIWLPACLILFSTGFTRLVAPQAAGSGIPEMKTVLRGVIRKDDFSFKALIAKVIGLTATLGTGLPLGKEGPFVHIASAAAFLLTKLNNSFKGIVENKTRHSEMLSAACAVGVATAFSTPVGGVLFSIEVTSVHFAVRNYWRGFFAAVCATVMHRLLAVWFKDEDTLTALFRTNFKVEFPFAPPELLVFALIGVLCGFLGALFVWLHRKYVMFKNSNCVMKFISNKSIFLYPLLVTLIYTSLTFPLGVGMFAAGEISTKKLMNGLFSNFSWVNEDPSVKEYSVIKGWQTSTTSVILHLFIYSVLTFLGAIVASTIPVPAGIFIPVFKVGAALGRMVGEGMAVLFPAGIYYAMNKLVILPGGYAIVGAAALAGAVTHTVSSSVIAFEITGQLSFLIPVMIAVLIANGIAQALQPSIFDSIIKMKNMPYLPNISTTSSKSHDIFVENFMIRSDEIIFIYYGMTYNELKDILVHNKTHTTLPLVDSEESMILLGSATRKNLIKLMKELFSQKRKREYFSSWKTAAEKSLIQDFKEKERLQLKKLQERLERTESKDVLPRRNTRRTSSLTDLSKFKMTPINDSIDEEGPEFNKQRRPSRFSVTKVVQDPRLPLIENSDLNATDENASVSTPPQVRSPVSPQRKSLYEGAASPSIIQRVPSRRGILKKTNSFIYEPNKFKVNDSSYATVHSGDFKSFKIPWRAKSLLKMDSKSTITFSGSTKVHDLPRASLEEKIRQEEEKWESNELTKVVDFRNCKINPAPHQLVERTNLLQVHSIFSLLGLTHSYVTAIGRLIGVVTLSELRCIIEEANTGEYTRRRPSMHLASLKGLQN